MGTGLTSQQGILTAALIDIGATERGQGRRAFSPVGFTWDDRAIQAPFVYYHTFRARPDQPETGKPSSTFQEVLVTILFSLFYASYVPSINIAPTKGAMYWGLSWFLSVCTTGQKGAH